jgi:nucleoside-diphosphate-sugar epimerase
MQTHSIIVFGGAGRTGSEVVKAALANGHHVSAFVYSQPSQEVLPTHPNLRVILGNARNSDDVEAALPGHDTVINIIAPKIGNKKNYDISVVATTNIVSAMQKNGIHRYIGQAGAWGTEFTEDASPLMRLGFIIFWPLRQIYAFKKIEDSIVKKSSLDWTLVRCGILTNKEAAPITVAPVRYRCKVLEIPKISRKSVAQFHLSIIDDSTYYRSAPIIFN